MCPGVTALGRDERSTRPGTAPRPLATVSRRVARRGWGGWVERFADNGERARSRPTHTPAKVRGGSRALFPDALAGWLVLPEQAGMRGMPAWTFPDTCRRASKGRRVGGTCGHLWAGFSNGPCEPVSAAPTAPCLPAPRLPGLPQMRAAPHVHLVPGQLHRATLRLRLAKDQRPGHQRRQNLTKETAKPTPARAAA